MTAGTPRERGLALIVVLWIAALLTLLAAGYSFSLRTEARLAADAVDRARTGAVAEAGVQRALALIAERGAAERGAVDASFVYDGFEVAIEIRPENGKVDLNTAPAPLLSALVRSAVERFGADGAAGAERVVDAVLDWRDPDSRSRAHGAEAPEYRAAGRDPGPRDRAFLSVTELVRVLGMTAPVYAALEPLVTVHSWSPQIDPRSAPVEVLRAVPGLDAEQVDAFVAARSEGVDERSALALLAGAERYLARGRAAVFTITARVESGSGVRATRRAIVKLNANPKQPVSILAWFHDAPAPPRPSPDAAAERGPAAPG